jgi:hypothetical protein
MVCRLIWLVLYIPKWILVRLLCGRDTPVCRVLIFIRLCYICLTEDSFNKWDIVILKHALLQFEPQPSRIPVPMPRPATAPPQEKRFPLSLSLLLPFISFFCLVPWRVTSQGNVVILLEFHCH